MNQLTAAAKLRLGNLLEDPAKVSSPSAREILGRTEAMLLQALEENRRIAHNLRPSDLDKHGLVGTCRIESAPNQGTRVTVEVPVQEKRREETPYRKKRGS